MARFNSTLLPRLFRMTNFCRVGFILFLYKRKLPTSNIFHSSLMNLPYLAGHSKRISSSVFVSLSIRVGSSFSGWSSSPSTSSSSSFTSWDKRLVAAEGGLEKTPNKNVEGVYYECYISCSKYSSLL